MPVKLLSTKRAARAARDRVEFGPPSGRVMVDWTPDLLRAAFSTAEGGSMRLAADLCDNVLADDRIIGALGTRVKGLLGLPFSFEAAEGASRRTPMLKAAAADWWTAHPESELEQILKWGIFFGLGPGQIVWKKHPKTGRVLPMLRFWHPRHLRYDTLTDAWFINTSTGEVPFTPGDGTWVLFTPYGRNRPWAQGVWRACGTWWLLKQYARQDWASYGEVHGKPIKLGTAPEKATAQARKDLAADLNDIGADTAIALPPGYDVKLLEATANTWATFKAQIDAADTGMAIAVAGQNLTSKVTGGSFAAANVHKDIRQDLIESDAEAFATALHEQSWSWWAEFNFGGRDLAPWPKWDPTPPEDLKAYADTLKGAADAIQKLDAIGIDTDPIVEKFRLQRRPETEKPRRKTPTGKKPVGEKAKPQPGEKGGVRLAATGKVTGGVIACLVPHPDVAAVLAVDGGEPERELHLTLAFFGRAEDLGEAALAGLLEEMRALAENTDDPVKATLSGVGRFSLPERDAFHATVDAPALGGLRDEVLWRARERGLEASTAHGFDPHITLAYLTHDAPNPLARLAPIETAFAELQVWIGPDRHAFPFGSTEDA